MLVVRIEPDGMEFEIAISGVCSAPPPSSLPSSATPASSLIPLCAPPVHLALQQVENIHNRVTKSSSAPLSEVGLLTSSVVEFLNEKLSCRVVKCHIVQMTKWTTRSKGPNTSQIRQVSGPYIVIHLELCRDLKLIGFDLQYSPKIWK